MYQSQTVIFAKISSLKNLFYGWYKTATKKATDLSEYDLAIFKANHVLH